ncbi:MAG: CHAT domain-containing protein [Jejuia sp.]
MKVATSLVKTTIPVALACLALNLSSQNKTAFSIEYLEDLINNDSLVKAEELLKHQEKLYFEAKAYDSLSKLVYFHGRIAQLKGDKNFLNKSKTAAEKLKNATSSPDVLYNVYSDISSLTVENNLFQESYNYNQLGFEQAKKTSEDRLNKMSNRAYGLASTAYFMTNYSLAKQHGLEAFKINENNPNASPKLVYSASNILGVLMQSENKLDSALYYYNKGIDALKDKKGDLGERYYYPAILESNTAVILMNKGRFAESIKKQQGAIKNYKIFIDSSETHPSIKNIKYNYLSTINDMGSNYVKLGQVDRALQLFEYNYEKAKIFFPTNSIQQVVFINQLAQGKWVANDGLRALELIDESYQKFKNLPTDYTGYMTYTIGTKASILESLNKVEDAHAAYQLSETLYQKVSPNTFSPDRLTKLRDAAKFYSRHGYVEEAEKAANKVLNAIKLTGKGESLEIIKANDLMAEVQFNLENYNTSIDWADRTLELIKHNKLAKSIDSSYWKALELNPILFKNKARLKLSNSNNQKEIKSIYNALRDAVGTLNASSARYSSSQDKAEFLSRTKPFLDFTSEVGMMLYNLTNENEYLNDIISMHESSLYNRIRSKLSIRDNMNFHNVPDNIILREKTLKDSLELLLDDNDINDLKIQRFVDINQKWQNFLNELKQDYPKYYEMRYQTIKQTLGEIKTAIPDNTTVVRYIFNNNNLYAYVISKHSSKLYQLNPENIEQYIQEISNNDSDFKSTIKAINYLYNALWLPFESVINTESVIIIPDGILFNLSFDVLTKDKITSFTDLQKLSLISKYNISYNYSLYLLDNTKSVVNYSNDFIAFAPEFNADMKEKYKINISDSITLDKTYLTLLPQPFSVDIAKTYSKLFDGSSFINENASKKVFTQEAKEHKIIHIGTHAESNNVSPELSRLIFAKNITDSLTIDDNSLYTFEIYNQNLASNLAILTACETGKPTYQAGEGMISLAHAFNYAGSESILTSLWKIDEKSSSEIIELFLKNIKKGMPKDKALQKAKLQYISEADGRTITPNYWAGLVLIGDVSPINLSTSTNTFWYFAFALIAILIVFLIVKRRKT